MTPKVPNHKAEPNTVRYRIGIDAGQNSVGLAAIAFDDDGYAKEILAGLSVIHDGGLDQKASGETSKVSRKASSGIARRTRRLFARKRQRLQNLQEVLEQAGMTKDHDIPHQVYEEWNDRDRLSREFVDDEGERSHLLHLAIMHIARHRGWRNPWHSFEALSRLDTPSVNMELTLRRAEKILNTDEQFETLGQAVAAVIQAKGSAQTIRPNKSYKQSMKPKETDSIQDKGPLMAEQLRQEDQLDELELILEMQKVPSKTATTICKAVFFVNKPHVPKELVGKDKMPGYEKFPRASRAALEFQEFRIRAFVANLRVVNGKSKEPLSVEQYDLVVSLLMNWREEGSPRILDIAEVLEVRPGQLNRDLIDQTGVSAPTDITSTRVEEKLKKKDPLRQWWDAASFEARSEMIAMISEVTDVDSINTDLLGDLLEILEAESSESKDSPSATMESLAGDLQSGRTAYSRESLSEMLTVMREQRCDEHEARKAAFDLDDDWRAELPTLDDPVDHPALQRIIPIVRRFLMSCQTKWGKPESVIIEHVREGFLGPTGLLEYRKDMGARTSANDRIRSELVAAGIARPSNSDIRRHEALQRQNTTCLYCGESIGSTTSQMDHIIADSLGGSNRRENLVAVCVSCNQAKGSDSFIEFAESGRRPGVSLEEALQRINEWQDTGKNRKQFARLKSQVKQRMRLRQEDFGELDERSLATTAYAATDLRDRIAGTLGIPQADVQVYRGAVTSEARKAGGVDNHLQLRGKEFKSRFDRRHHAIDAAVVTSLDERISRILAERSSLRQSQKLEGTQKETWKEFQGRFDSDQEAFREWLQRIGSVADSLKEAIDNDKIPVVRPLRLNTRVGAVHDAIVRKFKYMDVGDSWKPEDIDRIVDQDIYLQMLELSRTSNSKTGSIKFQKLESDKNRFELLRGENAQIESSEVAVYPKGGGMLRVRKGAVAIGGSIHHARIYAWKYGNGFGFGWIRVFAGELGPLGLSGKDVLTCGLPAHSASMRNAQRGLREKIENGQAKMIGWVTQNDEIELNPYGSLAKPGKMGDFLKEFSDSRWTVTGLPTDTKIGIAPGYLAKEGLSELDECEEESAGIKAARTILGKNVVLLAVNVVFQDPSLLVIRRTALGRPRWSSDSLPSTWSPWRAAEAAFEE